MSTTMQPISTNPRPRVAPLAQLLAERQQCAQEFLDARAHTTSPSEQIAYALDARLVMHPEATPAGVLAEQRRDALLRAIKTQTGRWKSGTVVRLYESLGYGVISKGAAARDLRYLARAGYLKRCDQRGVTFYKRRQQGDVR